jgi:hypothetical protein
MRKSAWRLSHDCAKKAASTPNTAATAIITIVLPRTDFTPGRKTFACGEE